jgi:hypothetical protein
MGRDKKEVDQDLLLDLIASGLSRKEMAEGLGITAPTLDARIAELRKQESDLLAYDKIRHLDLISVQSRIIQHVTDDKLAAAPLGQLANAYVGFGKMEQLLQGKPTEIHGLMGYLMRLEKEDIESRQDVTDTAPVVDAEYEQLELGL